MTKTAHGGRGLFHLDLHITVRHWRKSWQELKRAGTWRQELNQNQGGKVLSDLFTFHTIKDHLSRNGTIYTTIGPLISTINHKNSSQTCLQHNLMIAVSPLTLVCGKLIKTKAAWLLRLHWRTGQYVWGKEFVSSNTNYIFSFPYPSTTSFYLLFTSSQSLSIFGVI